MKYVQNKNNAIIDLVFGGCLLALAPVVLSAPLPTDIEETDCDITQINLEQAALEQTNTASPDEPILKSAPLHQTMVYDFTLQYQGSPYCGQKTLILQLGDRAEGISTFINPTNLDIQPGETANVFVSVTANSLVNPAVYSLPIKLFNPISKQSVTQTFDFQIQGPSECVVDPRKELMITDLSVVGDPVRTTYVANSTIEAAGAWSFGHLMSLLSPQPEKTARMVEDFIKIWTKDQVINGIKVPARPGVQGLLLKHWPRTADGHLDLAHAPFRLLAIVNRLDLRHRKVMATAGEGRFVFGVLDKRGNELPFTLIFEYDLPLTKEQDVQWWAEAWHQLGSQPFPSQQFNLALQRVTDRFIGGEGYRPSLSAIRTNEAALNMTWELREFKVFPDGSIKQVPVHLTPDGRFIRDSELLAEFVNEHDQKIAGDDYSLPLRVNGESFAGGSAINNLKAWTATTIQDPEARHKFSLNTCNGCHGSAETHTEFLHISPRKRHQEAILSAFLRGIAVLDPVSGERRVLNELGRRKAELEKLVCDRSIVAVRDHTEQQD